MKLSPKQKKIAAKASPRNKIDGKDFAVLKAEKAKGRGMGLQDEKMKPGKIMRAQIGGMGKATNYKKYLSALKEATKKPKIRAVIDPIAKAAKATKYGKIAAGVAGAALLAKTGLEKLYEKRTGKKPFTKRPDKKMGGGMMMRPRPMGYDQGDLASAENVYKKKKSKGRKKVVRQTQERDPRRFSKKTPLPGPGKRIPGGGIPNVPGRLRRQPVIPTPKLAGPQMSTGGSVTVKVKLGRNKPTKLL